MCDELYLDATVVNVICRAKFVGGAEAVIAALECEGERTTIVFVTTYNKTNHEMRNKRQEDCRDEEAF